MNNLNLFQNVFCFNGSSTQAARTAPVSVKPDNHLLIFSFILNISYLMSYHCYLLHFQNHATLFPGFVSKIVSVISEVVFVFALLLAAENRSDFSVSRGISVFKPCWQLSPEKIQCMKEQSVEKRTKNSN